MATHVANAPRSNEVSQAPEVVVEDVDGLYPDAFVYLPAANPQQERSFNAGYPEADKRRGERLTYLSMTFS